MKNIAVITSTRAEYGLLQPLVKNLRLHENEELKISLVVTGTHLSDRHGRTISEIIDEGVRIDKIVEVRLSSDTDVDIALNQADIVVKFTRLFVQEQYMAVVILGDRYEMQMVAIAATNAGTPIFHLCGGDTTEGAIDEAVRHSITKMSYLHLTTNSVSRSRVIQLGEDPDRVFNVGSTSIDNIKKLKLMDKKEALDSVGMSDCRYAIGTYHPVTLENQDIESDMMEFINAIKAYPNISFIITKSNADKGGDIINSILDRGEKKVSNLHVFASLGARRYLSLMKYAEFVIGNSSSGIVETPAMHIPTVNIGDRQKGRLQSESTINCGTSCKEIKNAIEKAMSSEMKAIAVKVESPYGDGNAAEKMTDIILETIKHPIDLKKKFYDLNIENTESENG